MEVNGNELRLSASLCKSRIQARSSSQTPRVCPFSGVDAMAG
jgi:hypothetical protein